MIDRRRIEAQAALRDPLTIKGDIRLIPDEVAPGASFVVPAPLEQSNHQGDLSIPAIKEKGQAMLEGCCLQWNPNIPMRYRTTSESKDGACPACGEQHSGVCAMAQGSGGKWISGAIKHPGALHRSLGVPQGQPIPAKKLNKAANSDNPTLARRANLAKTLKSFH